MSRAEFTTITKRAARKRSRGICECHRMAGVVEGFTADGCGRPLGAGNTFYEHIEPSEISRRKDVDNCAVLTKTCWRIKTDTYDKPVIAKCNRVRDKARNIRPEYSRPIPGSRRSYFRKRMNGDVERRT